MSAAVIDSGKRKKVGIDGGKLYKVGIDGAIYPFFSVFILSLSSNLLFFAYEWSLKKTTIAADVTMISDGFWH